ncbi:nuclear transport factor 2 family protein [Streptomyces sp. NPDC090085]|uniref:nuclear transport factor 2 family protein n=1 Tax=Streptomyces sp. NPDC090085 TaxID=3365943 RepID=UPI0038019C77
MITPHTTTAVLGLGRMGSAFAARLSGHGHHVIGWTRSGRAAPEGCATAGDPAEAVAAADVVLLSLFDGRACREVLDRVHGALRPGAVVLNTASIAPAEAAELSRRTGPAYVHAPVLGSVAAAASGGLEILTAAAPEALERALPVLRTLGGVRSVADAATAAALKLVANATLAGSVLALRDALQQADALGLSRPQVLDVLERGQLGRLVGRKRAFLGAGPGPGAGPGSGSGSDSDSGRAAQHGPAEFTVGALAKDTALLAAASRLPLRSAAELAGSPAGPGADIALAATVPAVDDAVLAPLRAYVRGHATGDPAHFRAAFLPTAHVEGVRDGAFVSWRLDDYCALFDGRPAADEAARSRRVDSVDVHGTVATAAMTLWHGYETFTDVFLLVRTGDGWRIANKAYDRRRAA